MKKLLAISAILLSSLLLLNCKKEEPVPCEECVATPFTSGFKTNLVGKWRFYKMAWLQGSNFSYKDTIELGNSYEIEIHESGLIDYYRNDSLINCRKIEVGYEAVGVPPLEPEGVVTGYLDCQKSGLQEDYKFATALLFMDTLRVSYQPFVYVNEDTYEESGKGFYYRMH